LAAVVFDNSHHQTFNYILSTQELSDGKDQREGE
jgi:hypothetical protein